MISFLRSKSEIKDSYNILEIDIMLVLIVEQHLFYLFIIKVIFSHILDKITEI